MPGIATRRSAIRRATAPRSAGSGWLSVLTITLAVGAAAAALCWRSLSYFFVTDDFALIEASRAPWRVGIPAHFIPRYGEPYRPLAQYGYFKLVNGFFGLQPRLWHKANLVLYLCTLALAAVAFHRLLRTVAGLTGALVFFGLHSALFLVVAWVALAGEIWIVFFSLLTVALYLHYLRSGAPVCLFGAVLACVAALLSKEEAAALPPTIIAAQLIFAASSGRVRGRVRNPFDGSAAVFCALEVAYLVLVGWVQGVPADGPYHPEIRLDAIWTLLSYLWLSVDLPQRANVGHLVLAATGLAFAALAALAVARRDRVALFGLIWYLVGILPVVFLPQHMFRYYLYWPLGGLSLMLGRGIEVLLARVRLNWRRGALLGALVAVIAAGDMLGFAYQRRTDATMAQAPVGQRVLQAIERDHPDLPNGATIYFVDPSHVVFYLLGYGAALRLYYPTANLHVYFAGEIPLPANPRPPVYDYRWNGETVVPVSGP